MAKAPIASAEPERVKRAYTRSEPKEAPKPPHNTAYLDHDDPNAAATHGGVDIVRGDNGLFLVPLAFVKELASHGFTTVSEGE